MSFDLYLAPASGFLDWDDARWDEFFCHEPENAQLGSSVYVGLVLDAITHNLEGDQTGSTYPLLMRISTEERVGWYHDEIGTLLDEIMEIKARLAALPINRSTLNCDNDNEAQPRSSEFEKSHPSRPLRNLYDVNFHFLDVFERLGRTALEAGQGLAVFF